MATPSSGRQALLRLTTGPIPPVRRSRHVYLHIACTGYGCAASPTTRRRKCRRRPSTDVQPGWPKVRSSSVRSRDSACSAPVSPPAATPYSGGRLAPTVIGHDHAVRARRHRVPRVVDVQNPLDHQRIAPTLAQPGDDIPDDGRIHLAGDMAHAAANVALARGQMLAEIRQLRHATRQYHLGDPARMAPHIETVASVQYERRTNRPLRSFPIAECTASVVSTRASQPACAALRISVAATARSRSI